MINKSLAFILIAAAAAATYAQTAVPRTGGESRVFSFAFDGSYLGVETAEITKENFGKYGLREVRGVAVEKVVDGSPAQAAGLQAGDVIVKFNGENVTSVRKLTRLVADVAPDHQANITAVRNGTERELTATLAKRPAPKFEDGAFALGTTRPGLLRLPDIQGGSALPPMTSIPRIEGFPPADGDGNVFTYRAFSSRQIGINVSPLTKQLAAHFGVENGVLVNTVRENSPAAKAGLKAGDIIVEAEGNTVKGDLDLIRAIGGKKDGDVQLTIVRDRSRQTLRVTPEAAKGFSGFDVPDVPSPMNLVAPSPPNAPAAPMPLNELLVPGRLL